MAKLICVFKRPKESQKSIALGVDCGSLGNMLKLSNSRIRWLATKVGRRNVVAAVLVFDEGCTHTFDLEEVLS
jgi:hypothetical protein